MNGIQKTKGKAMLRAFMVCALLVALLVAAYPVLANAANSPVYIPVEQVFNTNTVTAADTFRYRLSPLDANNPMPATSAAEGYSFKIEGDKTFDIGPIDYTKPGVYGYSLYQVIDNAIDGYIYDKNKYTIYVYVDWNYNVVISALNTVGEKVSRFCFINGYILQDNGEKDPGGRPAPGPGPAPTAAPAAPPAKLPTKDNNVLAYKQEPDEPELFELFNKYIPISSVSDFMNEPTVKHTVSGIQDTDKVFMFKLEAMAAHFPMPADSIDGVKTISIIGSGEGSFGRWIYDSPGVYYYTVSQADATAEGFIHDGVKYLITDTVTDVDGELVLTRIITKAEGGQVSEMTFTSTYVPVNTTTADTQVKPGVYGPKTGDAANTPLNIALFAIGGLLVLLALALLLKRSKPDDENSGSSLA